jgi:SLT domain-containing protein
LKEKNHLKNLCNKRAQNQNHTKVKSKITIRLIFSMIQNQTKAAYNKIGNHNKNHTINIHFHQSKNSKITIKNSILKIFQKKLHDDFSFKYTAFTVFSKISSVSISFLTEVFLTK